LTVFTERDLIAREACVDIACGISMAGSVHLEMVKTGIKAQADACHRQNQAGYEP
jgi:hypothetical protein